MSVFKIEGSVEGLTKQLEKVSEKNWPFVISLAANRTADAVLKKYREEMPKYLDRPRPFTLNSMYVKRGNKKAPEATVEWRQFAGKGVPAGKYLIPQVEGGNRKQKGFEKALSTIGLLPSGWVAVPTNDVRLDAQGNVPGSYITRILSFLRADRSGTQNRGTGKRTNAKKVKFFGIAPESNTRLGPGIYERMNMTLGSAIRKVFVFLPKANYGRRFPFTRIGEDEARAQFPIKLDEAIQRKLNDQLARDVSKSL